MVDADASASLAELLAYLAEHVDARFADLATRGTTGNSWINNVLINDRRMDLPRDLHIDLHDGDQVRFIQPIAGG